MKQWLRSAIAVLFVFAMAGVAHLAGEREVIFPEMLAPAVGMWVTDGKPRKVNSLQFVLLITGASVAGVLPGPAGDGKLRLSVVRICHGRVAGIHPPGASKSGRNGNV